MGSDGKNIILNKKPIKIENGTHTNAKFEHKYKFSGNRTKTFIFLEYCALEALNQTFFPGYFIRELPPMSTVVINHDSWSLGH